MSDLRSRSRVFAAIRAPFAFKETASAYRNACGELPGVRWVPDDNLHVTLFFVGDVFDDNIPEMEEKLNRIALTASSFSIELDCFCAAGNPRNPSMIWGKFKRHASFKALAGDLSDACSPFMIQPAASFPDPIPHITLARASRRGVITNLPSFNSDPGPVVIDRIALWKTHRLQGGVRYEELGVTIFGE